MGPSLLISGPMGPRGRKGVKEFDNNNFIVTLVLKRVRMGKEGQITSKFA